MTKKSAKAEAATISVRKRKTENENQRMCRVFYNSNWFIQFFPFLRFFFVDFLVSFCIRSAMQSTLSNKVRKKKSMKLHPKEEKFCVFFFVSYLFILVSCTQCTRFSAAGVAIAVNFGFCLKCFAQFTWQVKCNYRSNDTARTKNKKKRTSTKE